MSGDGPYALFEPCGVLTIRRYERLDEAVEQLRIDEEEGCRSAPCHRGVHWLVDLRTGKRPAWRRAA
jgi:hypothetical protein